MTAYDEIDAQIVSAIRSGKTRFYQIHNSLDIPFRVADRRLQAIRKRGLIVFKKGEWSLVPLEEERPK